MKALHWHVFASMYFGGAEFRTDCLLFEDEFDKVYGLPVVGCEKHERRYLFLP